MFHSSIRHSAIRILLLAGILESLALACDLKSPVDPDTTDGYRLQPPDHVMYSVVPSGLSASALSWSQISISWARSPSATGYDVFRSTTGATGSYTQLTSTTASTSYVDTGLTGSTAYCYEVRAVKTAGKNTSYSAFSSAACATTLAPPVVAPSETDAVPDAGRIVIKWKDNSSDEDGFHIERSASPTGPWVQAVNAVANATSAYTYSVSAEQQACFRVIAFNAIGPSLPSIPDCTTLPAGPSGLSATVAQQSINLTWTDNSAVEDGYKVSRSGDGAVWTTSLPANAVSYRDVSAAPDVSYRYVVQALKDGGYSVVSNQVTAVVPTSAPASPGWAAAAFYLDSEGYGWNYLTVWWGAEASTNEEGFRVEYSPDGRSGWSLYATVDADVSYFQQQFSVFDPLPPSGCYRVIAFNEIGSSSPSSFACAEPGADPSDLTATAIDQQTIDLAWTDNAKIETGYVVIRSTGYDGTYEVIATLPADATSFHDTGLASGYEYWYAVAAVEGESNWSNYSNFASATTGDGSSLQSSPNAIRSRVAPSHPVRVKGVTPHVRPHLDSRRTR